MPLAQPSIFSSTVYVCAYVLRHGCVDSLSRKMGSVIQQEINFDYRNVLHTTYLFTHTVLLPPTHKYKSVSWYLAFEHLPHDFFGRTFIWECFMCVATALLGNAMLDLLLICILHAILLITVPPPWSVLCSNTLSQKSFGFLWGNMAEQILSTANIFNVGFGEKWRKIYL